VFGLLPIEISSQKLVDAGNTSLSIQPTPQKIEATSKSIILGKKFIPIYSETNEEKKAADYLKYLFEKCSPKNYSISMGDGKFQPDSWKIKFKLVPFVEEYINEQYYSIQCSLLEKEIKISSPSQLGLLFAVSTFSKLIVFENSSIKINLYNIVDFPLYRRREFAAQLNPSNVEDVLNFALMNKIETVAIASRIYPWYEINDEYRSVLEKIKSWKDRFGGPKIMQMHNIYDKKEIEITNSDDIQNLKKVIEYGIKKGIEKLMILADDTAPFKFGDGYVLTSDNDKKKFHNMAEAHCFLINDLSKWMNSRSFVVELYYCPAFYTYEDMHYGDIGMYKSTPWENDAVQPLQRDLGFLGLNLPEDVFIIWTGPNVRSRKISIDDLSDWTSNLKGKIPFLWDNTIYSHHAFTSTPMFTAWDNYLPQDYHLRTAGNGMFINCDLATEETKAAAITANDYLWNPIKYNPEKSINIAIENLYDKQTAKLLFQFKDVELDLREKIGGRRLWFEADSLWSLVRKIRFITEKNPWYYQQNYNRFKALVLQLKNSVPEPESKKIFVKTCISLDSKRNKILGKIKKVNNEVYKKIEHMILPIPDFESIQ
jgi:hypothetical protein